MNKLEISEVRMIKLRKLGRLFPIEPDRNDVEALDYIDNIRIALVEFVNEKYEDDNLDILLGEFAEGTIPYNDYKAVNAYAQLGLYLYDPRSSEFEPELLDGDEMLTIIRSTMYYKSKDILLDHIN
tara:strand:+ start:119 stop:496 length:378 start_codon:yes stop_codon:yes gene_type:complete